MDFRRLRYFARVARAGSFSRAAGELRIAQPALSRSVRELETELGQSLLVRHGRGVRLTPAGTAVLARAEEIDHLVGLLRADATGDTETSTGQIALGVPPAAGLLIGPALVKRLKRLRPQVALHIREGVSSLIHEWLLDRRIDVGVVYNAPPVDGIRIAPVLRERMVLVGPPDAGRRGLAGQGLRIKDLADLPLIMPSPPHNNRRLLEQAAAQHGIRLGIGLEVDSVALTKVLVGAGLGYTVLTYASVRPEVARGDLSARPIERPPLMAMLAVATLSDARGASLTSQVADTLRAVVLDLVGRGRWHGAELLIPHRQAARSSETKPVRS